MRRDRNTDVLLIEKNASAMDTFIKNTLKTLPEVQVHSVRGAAQAVDLLLENDYDVIICDSFLAQEERLELVGKICARRPGTAMLLISDDPAITDEDLPPSAKALCVASVFHKPVTLRDFYKVMKKTINAIKTEKARR